MTLTADRTTFLGASEIGMLLPPDIRSPHGGPIELWQSKTGMVEDVDTDAKRSGRFLEGAIADMFAEETGLGLMPVPTIRHPRSSIFAATPDRLILKEGGVAPTLAGRVLLGQDDIELIAQIAQGLLEIKNVGIGMRGHWGDEEDAVPFHTICQAQMQMACTGLPWVRFAVLVGGNQPRFHYIIHRDDELIASLEEMGERFWNDHVLTLDAPSPDGTEVYTKHLRAKFPHATRPMEVADAEANRLGQQALTYKAEIKASEALLEQIEQQLMLVIGESEGLVGEGWKATWKAPSKGAISYGKACEEMVERARGCAESIRQWLAASPVSRDAWEDLSDVLSDLEHFERIVNKHIGTPSRRFLITGNSKKKG